MHGIPHNSQRFQRLLLPVMGAVRGAPSGAPGSLIPGLPTCAQPPPLRLVANGVGSINQGVAQ